MSFRAVLDADVLVPVPLCDLLLRLAEKELFDPFWSDRILNEVRGALTANLGVSPNKADGRVRAMQRAFEDATVDAAAVDRLERSMGNEAGDRHVLAAAVAAGAQAIVTSNVRDFPPEACRPFGLEAIHPDDFLIRQLGLDARAVRIALDEQAADLIDPPLRLDEVLEMLTRFVPRSVDAVRALPPI